MKTPNSNTLDVFMGHIANTYDVKKPIILSYRMFEIHDLKTQLLPLWWSTATMTIMGYVRIATYYGPNQDNTESISAMLDKIDDFQMC